jgi:hypothetical protein
LNYELRCYTDAQADFPDTSIVLETEKGRAYHIKTDTHRRLMWYSFEKENEGTAYLPLDVDMVNEIINLNRKGVVLNDLQASEILSAKEPTINYQNSAGEDNISRFEEKKKRKKANKPNKNAATPALNNKRRKKPNNTESVQNPPASATVNNTVKTPKNTDN